MKTINTIILEELIKSKLFEQTKKWSLIPLKPNSDLLKKIRSDKKLLFGFLVKLTGYPVLYHNSLIRIKYRQDIISRI